MKGTTMTQRTWNILNDLDCGSSVLFICIFLGIIWYAGEPDFGDGFLHWMTDGEITYVAPVVVPEPVAVVAPAIVPATEAPLMNNGTDPFAKGAETITDWPVKPALSTAEPVVEGDG